MSVHNSNHDPRFAHAHKHEQGSRRLFEAVRTALLLGLALYFTDNVTSGRIVNYINPQFGWLSLVAAALFALLGLAGAYSLLVTPLLARARARGRYDPHHDPEDSHEHHDGHDHHHSRISWTMLAIMAIPLALGTLVPSRSLGASSINTNMASANVALESSSSTKGDPATWNIWEWQRTYNANTYPDEWFNGRRADLIGFVFRPEPFPPDHFVAARYVMQHCAADAFGVGMLVAWPGGQNLPMDTWVRVQGAMTVTEFDGEPTLMLKADSVDDTIGEPQIPYIFPVSSPDQWK
jgi:putative membrane protein